MVAPNKDVRYRWTAEDSRLANAPKDEIVTAEGKDPPTVTPYGIHPQEQRTMLEVKSKAQKTIAQMKEGDEVMVPLAYSTAGFEARATRFFRTGHRWEKLEVDGDGKPKIAAAKLGDLCNALYQSDKLRFSHYDLSNKGEAWDFPRRVWKLFDHWENTDYRYAVVKSGSFSWDMDPLQISTEAPDADDAGKTQRCLWVMAKIPEKQEALAAPSSKDAADGDKNQNPVALPAAPDYDKDPDPPFNNLDRELLDTLKRSFKARILKYPGGGWIDDDGPIDALKETTKNLANGWWNNHTGVETKTLNEALDFMGTGLMNILVRLFDRIKAIDPSYALWRQIKYIRNGWGGGSAGYKVVYLDPPALRRILDALVDNTAGHKVARDKLVGSLDHQRLNVALAYSGAQLDEWLGNDPPPPDVDTWREVDIPQEESVHFCVDKQDIIPAGRTCSWPPPAVVRHVSSDDIHIDWKSPVEGIEPDTKKCKYDSSFYNKAKHVTQAKWGVGVPEDRFVGMYEMLERCKDSRETMKNDASFGPDLDTLDQEWQAKKWGLSLAGKKGYEDALPYYDRAKALIKRLSVVEAAAMPPGSDGVGF
ncbi:MAG: hypothetical protein ABI193_02390 [Minicystis sp.]